MSFSFFGFATAQQGDVLVLKGKKYFIYTNPAASVSGAEPWETTQIRRRLVSELAGVCSNMGG